MDKEATTLEAGQAECLEVKPGGFMILMVSREICWSGIVTSGASDPEFKPAAEFIRARKRDRKDQQPNEENDSNVYV